MGVVIPLRPQGTPADLMARTRLWLHAEGFDPTRRYGATGEPLKLTPAEVVRIRELGGPRAVP